MGFKEIFNRRIIEKVIDLIFPPVCGFCDKLDNDFLCEKCKDRLGYLKVSKIDDYKNVPIYFDEHFYMFKYENEVRDKILQYKFDEKSYLYKSYAKLFFYDEVFRRQFIEKYDYVVSVPIHKKRMRKRGYNQSKLIAKEIVELVCDSGGKIEYVDNVIYKCKNIVAQSSLEDKLERIRNIKGAFDVGAQIGLVRGKKVAVFDDVFTSGATVNECARLLRESGAESVGIFCIAKA